MSEFEQILPIGEPNDTYAAYFTGRCFVAPLASGNDVNMMNVTFEPGCINYWHIHHEVEQYLLRTAGEGWCEIEGQPPVKMTPGTAVVVPEGTRHWHGAAQDGWFSHVALMAVKDGMGTEWLEPVDDEHYRSL